MCPVQGQCCAPGTLRNFNTDKGFKELDKGAAMQEVVLCNTLQAVLVEQWLHCAAALLRHAPIG